MTTTQENLNRLLNELKDTKVKLVAVSKYHPVEMLREAYDAGQRIFGESHVQEMDAKHDVMPKDIEWHFIGHLSDKNVLSTALHNSISSFLSVKDHLRKSTFIQQTSNYSSSYPTL